MRCDIRTPPTASASRGVTPTILRKHPGTITTGLNGSQWDTTMDQMGACYQAIKVTDPATAKKYPAQAHNIISAMTFPRNPRVEA